MTTRQSTTLPQYFGYYLKETEGFGPFPGLSCSLKEIQGILLARTLLSVFGLRIPRHRDFILQYTMEVILISFHWYDARKPFLGNA